MNVTIKLDDTLCREARHRAVDADLSLSGWIAGLICERLGLHPATGRPGKTLLEMLGQAVQKPEMCFLSAFTLLEIRLGIEMARKKDKKKAEGLEAWYQDRAKPGFAGRVLPVDEAVREMCDRLHAERPRSFRDGLIFATAAVHQLTVVTRNVKDFADGGVRVINP